MSETLKKTIGHLPELLNKNAEVMMQRMLDFMQNVIAADPALGPSSYLALLLKMSTEDMVTEFEQSLAESMVAIQRAAEKPGGPDTGLGLSLQADDAKEEEDFARSNQLFTKLMDKTKSLGIPGLAPYRKDIFLAAINDAFTQSKIDADATKKLMPLARKALNAELVRLYEKLSVL
jgi:hypothetical protein